MSIKDSGNRRQFESGAVRDIQEGKGRCDLLPLDAVSMLLSNSMYQEILGRINIYLWNGDISEIITAVKLFMENEFRTVENAVLEVSVHYEQGCNKYGERNWEKGIPAHSYVDSGVRHLMKYLDGWNDERHDRAFIWNMLGLIWTHKNKPELLDLPFNNK